MRLIGFFFLFALPCNPFLLLNFLFLALLGAHVLECKFRHFIRILDRNFGGHEQCNFSISDFEFRIMFWRNHIFLFSDRMLGILGATERYVFQTANANKYSLV